MTARPSIVELQRQTESWPTQWRPSFGDKGEWDGEWSCIDNEGLEDRVSADTGEDYANALALHVATLVNATPVLLEIAAAALAWRRAVRERRDYGDATYANNPFDIASPHFRAEASSLDAVADRLLSEFLAALAKVTP